MAQEGFQEFLLRQRWFGDKARTITSVQADSCLVFSLGNDLVALAVIRVDFAVGEPAYYFVPLIASSSVPSEHIATAEYETDTWSICDAIQSLLFRRWLLD